VDFRGISHNGQRFVVSQRGHGPDIVLLHGFPDTPHSWAEIEAVLVDAGWRVSVPWLRGYHEDTLVVGRGYDPETLGRDGLGLLDAIGARRAVIVGHDWGALIAYVAATLAPERIRAIVTSGIPHPSVLQRTPLALWGVRHFFALKLPWAARACRRNDFAYFDELYPGALRQCSIGSPWCPGWSSVGQPTSLRRISSAAPPSCLHRRVER
jgi:pimeloyl-ACP methyl ester carboxylesterase